MRASPDPVDNERRSHAQEAELVALGILQDDETLARLMIERPGTETEQHVDLSIEDVASNRRAPSGRPRHR